MIKKTAITKKIISYAALNCFNTKKINPALNIKTGSNVRWCFLYP